MSGGSKTTTQSTSSEPWEKAQPTIETALGGAQDIYKSGEAWQPNTASMVVPWSEQTQQGMQGVMDTANQFAGGNNLGSNVYSQLQSIANAGGFNPYQQGVAGQWQGVAGGNDLENTSPAFQRILDRVQSDAATQANLSMSGAGRYGSGAHGKALGTAVGDVTARMLDANYGRELQRMDNARNSLAGLGQQGVSNLANMGANAGNYYGAQLAPYESMMKIGQMNEDLYARTLQDQNRIYDQTRLAPLAAVEWLNAIGSGAGSLGGSGTSSVQQPTPNPFLQVATSLAGPLGAAFFSDIRLKTDIEQIGNTAHGLPLYEFAYKSDPDTRYTGVMAQDVLDVMPDAVITNENGFYMVNYGMLGIKMERVQ